MLLVAIILLVILKYLQDMALNQEHIDAVKQEEEPQRETVSVETYHKNTPPAEITTRIEPLESFKSFEFRPRTFAQFIGQKRAKHRIQTVIKKAHKNRNAHLFIDGIQGHGKTTFIYLFAEELKAKIIYRIGSEIEGKEDVEKIIEKINNSTEKYVVLFIDETDTMEWKILKMFNTIIQKFTHQGKPIRPFIFVGATINKHLLDEHNSDLLGRIWNKIKFERYSAQEIKQLLVKASEQLYIDIIIPQEVLETISKNCKYNPRLSLALLDDYYAEGDIDLILRNHGIIKDGLTEIDINILRILKKATRPMGSKALSQKCKLGEREYLKEFEPFLCEYDYINRVPSRVLGEKGKELLEKLTKET